LSPDVGVLVRLLQIGTSMVRRVKLKRQMARAGSRLQALVAAPAIYLVPSMVAAAPFLVLYWLYQPTVLANPRLSAYKPPVATLLLPPIREAESLEPAAMQTEVSLADVAKDLAQPGLDQASPEARRGADDRHLVVNSHNLHVKRNSVALAPTHSVKTAVSDPDRRTGVAARSAADAYAYAPDQLRW
jgi:hypothetical protein